MGAFRAVVVEKAQDGQMAALRPFDESDLMEGDVTVRVTHSTINYKDGLAITGWAPVVRRWPMIPGIDLAGTVETSAHPDFTPGDAVILNGWGTGETHLGAFAERSRIRGDWLVPLPAGLSAAEAMAIGTAGYTAMLSVMALERHGLKPSDGPAVVTGASGGGRLGRDRASVDARLARDRLDRAARGGGLPDRPRRGGGDRPGRPIRPGPPARQGALGGGGRRGRLAHPREPPRDDALRRRDRRLRPRRRQDLPTSVAPFILRGVSLLGIDSVMAPKTRRLEAWDRLARDLDRERLAAITTTIPLDAVIDKARDLMEGRVRGRVVVEIG